MTALPGTGLPPAQTRHAIPTRPRHPLGVLDVVTLVLGLDLWGSLLLIPLLHQRAERLLWPALLAVLPLCVLLVGVLWRLRWVVLGVFPVALLPPVIARPSLVGVNALSGWTFLLVAAALVAFVVGASLCSSRVEAPQSDLRGHEIDDATAAQPYWRARRLLYAAFGVLAAVFPAMFVYVLYLRPGAFDELRRFYPDRANAAAALFGVVALGIWLTIFFFHFARPLRAHIRGDRPTREMLHRLEQQTRLRHPRRRFYFYVTIALALMAMLFYRLQ